MTVGASAWLRPRGGYKLASPMMGRIATVDNPSTTYDDVFDSKRINLGILALQKELILLGYDPGVPDGLYGNNTASAVRKFQTDKGRAAVGPSDGWVGSATAKAIFSPRLLNEQDKAGIPNDLLRGLIRKESSYDPAAQGYETPYDLGLAQINTDPELKRNYTLEQVFDLEFAIAWTVREFIAAYKKFESKPDLAWICAIANHNGPAWALKWFNTGEPPNGKIAAYVADVLLGG